jgi:hypothetical protein
MKANIKMFLLALSLLVILHFKLSSSKLHPRMDHCITQTLIILMDEEK